MGLIYLLRSKIFVSEDRQLQAVHLILDFELISRVFQEIGHTIRAGDPRINRIDVSKPDFLAREDHPKQLIITQVDSESEKEEERMDKKKATWSERPASQQEQRGKFQKGPQNTTLNDSSSSTSY